MADLDELEAVWRLGGKRALAAHVFRRGLVQKLLGDGCQHCREAEAHSVTPPFASYGPVNPGAAAFVAAERILTLRRQGPTESRDRLVLLCTAHSGGGVTRNIDLLLDLKLGAEFGENASICHFNSGGPI